MDTEAQAVQKSAEIGDVDHDSPDECSGLSHIEAMNKVQAILGSVIKNDPLLCDLHSEITLEEVHSQITLEYGQAMVVNVRRFDGEIMSVVVGQDANVLDLKHAVKRYFLLRQSRKGEKRAISWKYIWKRYWLYYDGVKLTDDTKPLKDYGIRNRTEITFITKLKER